MSDFFAISALMPDGELKKISLEEYQGKHVLLIFYPGDFTPLAKSELLAFAEQHEHFMSQGCQILACSTDSGETHVAWTASSLEDENGLHNKLPFPLLADHSLTLTRKFDLLDSNQGTAKHALLLLDPRGFICHKQIGDNKVGFSVDDALSTVISSKLPLFDSSSFEASDDLPPAEVPPPPPPPIESDEDSNEEVQSVIHVEAQLPEVIQAPPDDEVDLTESQTDDATQKESEVLNSVEESNSQLEPKLEESEEKETELPSSSAEEPEAPKDKTPEASEGIMEEAKENPAELEIPDAEMKSVPEKKVVTIATESEASIKPEPGEGTAKNAETMEEMQEKLKNELSSMKKKSAPAAPESAGGTKIRAQTGSVQQKAEDKGGCCVII